MFPLSRPVFVLAAVGAMALAGCTPDTEESSPGLTDPAVPALSSADLATTQGFRKQVTVVGIREHLTAFQ